MQNGGLSAHRFDLRKQSWIPSSSAFALRASAGRPGMTGLIVEEAP
jgi:hypothetical protein